MMQANEEFELGRRPLYSKADYERDMRECGELDSKISQCLIAGVVDGLEANHLYALVEKRRAFYAKQLARTRFILSQRDEKKSLPVVERYAYDKTRGR